MTLFGELSRRNVFRAGAAYLVVAWLVVQIIVSIEAPLNLPDWFDTAVIVLLAAGFPIVLAFAWAFELTPQGLKYSASVDPEESITPVTGRKLNNLIITVLSLAVVFLVVDNYVFVNDLAEQESAVRNDTGSSGIEDAAIAELENSIAVLPFVNLSNDPDQGYFADGLTEELLNKLAQVSDLSVAARTSSFYFKDRNEDVREIAEILNVVYVLEGSVRKSGDDVRVTAQLVQADNGFHLWSGTFDRELTDVFAIQDEIARDVTTTLSVALQLDEFDRPGLTSNVEAYDAYLQGFATINESGIEEVQTRLGHFLRAVELDPDFGLAWLALRGAYGAASLQLGSEETGEFARLREEATARALSVAPDMPELRLLQAQIQAEQFNWLEAEALLQELIAENSSMAVRANSYYGFMLHAAGRSTDAIPYLIRARRLDPLNVDVAAALSKVYLTVGRFDESIIEADRGLALDVASARPFLLAQKMIAAYEIGDYDLAVQFVAAGGSPGDPVFEEIAGYIADGNIELAERTMREALGEDVSPIFNAAMSFFATVLEDYPLAYELLFQERELQTLGRFSAMGVWVPLNSRMRQLPEFKRAVSNARLDAYWRTTGNWADTCQALEDGADFECF